MVQRSTFRNQQTTIAWQKKIRDERAANFKGDRFWERLDLSLSKAVVREINRATAKKVILEYEWLGDMAVTNKFYGIFFGAYCGGVICINTNGSSSHGHKKYGINQNELSYFARGACPFWTPTGTASKLLSFALKLEAKRGAKVAQAFADTDAGEYGTVYQATNWICLGLSGKDRQWHRGKQILDTRTFCSHAHKRGITTTLYAKMLAADGWTKQEANRKIRYCYVMATGAERDRIMAAIKPLVAPYPKRPVEAENEHAAIVQ